MSEPDTREQLEADVHQYANPSGYKNTLGASWEKKMLSFLDRQAAITTAYCTSEGESCCEACRAAQKRKIAELTAERDKWRAKRDIREVLAENAKFWEDKHNQWKAELETYVKVPDQGEHTDREQDTRRIINEIRASFGAPPTTMTDEQIEAGREVYGAKLDYDMAVIDEVQDSRAQIEDDIDRYRDEECHDYLHVPVYRVHSWLKRQAAITERECMTAAGLAATEAPALQAKVDKLTAERDQLSRDLTAEHALVIQFEDDNERLREAIDAMNNGQFYAMYKAKCEECEQLKKVARTQAESFKKLECELAGKQ